MHGVVVDREGKVRQGSRVYLLVGFVGGRNQGICLRNWMDNVSRFRQMDVLDKEGTKPAYDYDIEKIVEGIRKNAQCFLGQMSG